MSSFPINNTQYLYVKRNGYANYSGATDQNSSVFGTSPIKQTTNEDSFVAFESNGKANNSNSETAQLRQSLNETKSKQGFIGKLWDGFKNLTGIGAGSSKAEKAITDYENGKISKEEMEKAVNGYTEGQKMVVDVVADMASGILAIGAFALAVPTGGASLAVGLGLATAVGAGSKVLIKGGDALLTGKEYSGKDLLYDTVTGGINGVLAPVTNGIGNTVTKTIGTKLGLTIVKEGAEEVVEQGVKQGVKQGLKSIVLNQTTDVIGGTVAKRAVALGAGMAVDGALGGAADNMVRAGLNGENVLEAGVQGAVGGLIMAPVIGGGFRVAGKAGKALGNKINTGKTLSSEVAVSRALPDGASTTKALPDGASTKIQGGIAPDEKKMTKISLQFFGKKATDGAPSLAKTIDDKAAKAIDLPNSVRNGDEIGVGRSNNVVASSSRQLGEDELGLIREKLTAILGYEPDDNLIKQFDQGRFAGSGITEVDYKRIKNDAYISICKQNTIEIDGRKIPLSEEQKIIYDEKLRNLISVDPNYCEQVIMSDAMFIEAVAVNYGIDTSGKTTRELFEILSSEYILNGKDILPNVSFELKEDFLEAFFGRANISDSLRTSSNGVGSDKLVHEANKALAERLGKDEKWLTYCGSSDKYKQFAALADTYKEELRRILKRKGMSGENIESAIRNSFEDEDHIIFRALQRDAYLDLDNVASIQSWGNLSSNKPARSFVEILSEKILDMNAGKPIDEAFINGTKLTCYGKNKFQTLVYSMQNWSTEANYIPQYGNIAG